MNNSNKNSGTAWTDVSILLQEKMVSWPGDPEFRIKRAADMEQGESVNLSEITLSSHSGTHVDAPRHFIREGRGIDQMPLDIAAGRVRVVQIKERELIKLEELEPLNIGQGESIFFKTRNSPGAWQKESFTEDFTALSLEGARYLVEMKTRLVGIDYLSIGHSRHEGKSVHRTLLGSGVWVVEGLDLTGIEPGFYTMVCLPLKIKDGDGAPARVIVRREAEEADTGTRPG